MSYQWYKAHVVVLSNFQWPGQDFFETFASTLQSSTIRIVLALAAIEDMELRSVGILYAFTNSDIDVEIYMKQPEGFQQGGKTWSVGLIWIKAVTTIMGWDIGKGIT